MEGAIALNLFFRCAAMDQPLHADLRGISGVESADVSNRVLLGLIVIVPRKFLREEFKERLVGRAVVHFAEDLLNFAKESARLKLAIRGAPEIAFDFSHAKVMFLHRQPDLGREPMKKLCSQLNGMIQNCIELREYPATDPFASFNNLNPEPCTGEINRGGKASYAGAEDEDVTTHVSFRCG